MKRMTILILLISISLSAFAPERVTLVIQPGTQINAFERLFQAVAYTESRNDPKAFNSFENAVGILQIRSDKLSDYNRNNGTSYKLSDCFDVEVSRKIFYWHCRGYKSIDLALTRWNGIGKQAENYLIRVKKYL